MNTLPISLRIAFAGVAVATTFGLLQATLSIAGPKHSQLVAKAQPQQKQPRGTLPTAHAAVAVALDDPR